MVPHAAARILRVSRSRALRAAWSDPRARRVVALCVTLLTAGVAIPSGVGAQEAEPTPRVLVVTAHPDDDAAFSGVLYQVTHHLDGVVDLALVTDGSGGFRYATLAEPIYGLELTDEAVARQYLPAIRKRELMAGGAIVGIRQYHFLDELDHGYTLDADTVLSSVWDTAYVRRRLVEIMERETYDVVLGLLPFGETHGHHKAATILALEAAADLPAAERPTVLGGFPCAPNGTPLRFDGLPGRPSTRVAAGEPLVRFDRTQRFGFDDRLDFTIIANWVIAEHKSQGAMQLLVNQGEEECYWFFDANGPDRREAVRRLFERLRL